MSVYLTPHERRVLVEMVNGEFDPKSAQGRGGSARNAMLWRLRARGLVELSRSGATFVITPAGREAVT